MANVSNKVEVSAAQAAALELAKGASPIAVELAVADQTYEAVMPKIASAVAKLLGVKPTFEAWEAVADEFQKAYIAKRNCVADSARNRWVAVCKYMAENFALEKPAKASVAATKKAKERAKVEKQVKAIKAKYVKPADAFAEAAELVKQGKVAEAKLVTQAAHELSKDVIADANKQASGALKKVRDDLRKEIGKCADIPALRAALEWLQSGKELKTEIKREAARKVSQANRVAAKKESLSA